MHNVPLISGIGAVLAVITACTIPPVSGTIRQICKREPRDEGVYEDADGKATPESERSFSAVWPKIAIVFFLLLATACSLAAAILSLQSHDDGYRYTVDQWMVTAAWFPIFIQAAGILAAHKSSDAYVYGALTFVSAMLQAFVLIIQTAKVADDYLVNNPTVFIARSIEILASVGLAFAAVILPRRPTVFYRGEKVDDMYTTSVLGRFTFSWPSSVLTLSTKKHNLDLADLPRPDHFTRANDVADDWKAHGYPSNRLWVSVLRAHKSKFALQWFLTLVASFLNFGPQWVILQILRILENRVTGESFGISVWVWVLWLGTITMGQALVESYEFWLSWAELTIPVRAQLAALIFEKAMRRKDVKAGHKKTGNTATAGSGANSPTVPSATDSSDEDENEDETESAKKTKQGTVNLIGVDGKRVGDFCSFQNLFPGSLFELIVSLAFLIQLLGWKPLAAGFAAMLIIMPVNIKVSKKYSEAQDRLMKLRDEKLEVVTEALQGIRQIKFSALEPQWEAKIGEVRNRELTSVWNVFMFDTVLMACWIFSPIALSAVSLTVYAYLHGQLTPSVAFVSLGVFRSLDVALSVVPELTTDLLDAWVSIKRIEDYLLSPDLEKLSRDNDAVVFDNASIAWPSDEKLDDNERFVLRDVSLSFPPGELSIISGKTGAGKSLMLSAILGEVDLLAGDLYIPKRETIDERRDDKATPDTWILPKSIAYVAQIPWIENATIKENITFGLPVDDIRYRKTVDVCALAKDFDMLADGEDTEIGANGINLSGGQKWRITLARAVYSRAGILVLDDIFSAVDAHVGRHIFEKCVNGELCAGRTRILVTHHVALCASQTKYLVELGDGRVQHAGLLSELEEDGTLERIKSHEQSAADNEMPIEASDTTDTTDTPDTANTPDTNDTNDTNDATAVNSDNSTENGEESGSSGSSNTAKAPKKAHAARKFVEDEKREEGAVRRQVYGAYLQASGGWPFWLGAAAIFVTVEALAVGRSWWLRIWTGQKDEEATMGYAALGQNVMGAPTSSPAYAPNGYYQQQSSVQSLGLHDGPLRFSATSALVPTSTTPLYTASDSLAFYIGIYVLLSTLSAIISSTRYLYVYHGSIRASRDLFAKLNFIILRAPLRWLDTVPVGRILNRFTADFNIIDTQMANSISFGSSACIRLMGIVIAGVMVSPLIVLLSLVLLAICSHFALLYIAAARPVKRLESTAKSPVFEQFGTALSGVATIRGFDKAQVYIESMYRKLDDWSTTTWHLILFNRWVGWRMNLVGSFFSVIVASVVLSSPSMDAALAGFALAFALDFASSVMWTVRLYANVELQMNAAERIIEYTELPTESLAGISPPAAWPTEGRIEVDKLVVSYAEDLPPVLKGLSFRVERNQRVGVVGRTGAGKSSLTLAFFRFLEARSGSIYIDGLDISKIKLSDLRSRLAIIPQDPVLFSGTIRSNLDPFDKHTDEELRDCLDRVHLTTARLSGQASPQLLVEGGSGAATPSVHNTNIFDDLQSPVSEGGLNLSQGQRQLLCLARAIVRRPRVMVLDEATSAVDMHTDGLIQRSIREEFTDSTLLVIAHRLSTIADFDRILVLSDGAVAEYGSPQELWAKGPETGVFRAMCEESGERDKLEKVVYGSGSD